jgi:outer membrane autotransporter protein
VTIPGTISGTGAVNQIGTGTTILTANNDYTGVTTISAGTLQLGNGGTSGSITGNVTDNSTLAFNRADTVTFPGVISGTGGVNQIGSGTTILNPVNPYGGPTNVTTGTLVVGDATAPSAALSGGGLTTVASGATLGGFGSIAGSVINNGTFAVGNALAPFASGPSTTFNVGGNLTNSGLITLVGAAPGNTLKVGGNFVGNGGSLALQTLLNAGGPLSNQSTDRLLIGGSADPTTVHITPVGTGAFTAANYPTALTGISIVQTAGASSVGAFTLAGGTISRGLYSYSLFAYGPGSPNGPADPSQTLIGAPGTNWDYRLQNVFVTPSGIAAPLAEPAPGDPPAGAPPAGARPEVAPQVPAYISAPTVLFIAGLEDINELHRRLGEIRDEPAMGSAQPFEAFVRAYGGPYQYTSNRSFSDFGYNFREDDEAIQFGGSGLVMNDEHGQLRVGLAGTFGRSFFTPSAIDGASSGMFNTEKLSGIATYQANSGFYVDAIVSGGEFDGHVSTAADGQTTGLNGTLVGLSLETGYPLLLGWEDLVAEPEVQLTWQHLNFSSRTDVNGLSVDLGSLDQGVGRIGGRLVRRFQASGGVVLSPYLKANLLQGFGDGAAVSIGEVKFDTGSYGTAIQVGGGVTGTLPETQLAVFGDVAYQHKLGDGGVDGWTFTGGLRVDF